MTETLEQFSQRGALPERSAGRIGIRDVAAMAKVSVATVSLVLSDNPRISRATQNRVRKVIARTGYRPNRLAQSLAGQYTHTLAILMPALRHGFADAYFGELVSGICDRAARLGHKVLLESAKPEFVKERRHIELFERRFVDGALCLGFNDRHPFLRDFAGGDYPMVVVNNYFANQKLDYIVCDYRAGASQVMNYLLQLGHRRIGMISGAPEAKTQRDLIDVHRRRLDEEGAALDDTWREDGRFTEEGGAAAAKALLSRHPDATALFCGNDKMALGAMHYLHQQGHHIPRDISVVGFDDMAHTAFANPSLTTVHLPLYEVGQTACEKLIERIRGRGAEHLAMTLATHLVVRESTAMAKA